MTQLLFRNFQLLEPDWEKFAEPLKNGKWRIPALQTCKFEKFVNGPESFTPDNNFIIGEAAERAPEAMLGLIYITAVLIPAGTATMRAFDGETSNLMEKVTTTADGLALIFDRGVAKKCFYNRAALEDAEAALDRLCPEPIAPNQEPMSVTQERWGRVPRAFIECADDKALPLAFQRQLHEALPCDPVVTLDSDHSPFLCMPGELADHLAAIAADFARRRRF